MPPEVVQKIAYGLSRYETIQGCTPEEIEELAHVQGIACLPGIYQDLLMMVGKKGLDFYLDGEATYEYLRATTFKNDFMTEIGFSGIELPNTTFVFFCHHGYIYYWFDTASCEDDPPVYGWKDDQASVALLADTLTVFLENYRQK